MAVMAGRSKESRVRVMGFLLLVGRIVLFFRARVSRKVGNDPFLGGEPLQSSEQKRPQQVFSHDQGLVCTIRRAVGIDFSFLDFREVDDPRPEQQRGFNV